MHPHVIIHLWTPDYFVEFAKKSLPISNRIVVRGFSQKNKYKEFVGRAFNVHLYSNLSAHITSHAFHVLANTDVEDKYKNYLPVNLSGVDVSKYALPEKYVVVPTGYTAKVREWLPEHINNVLEYIVSKGYTPVFLGKSETPTGNRGAIIKGTFDKEICLDKGINLINKTSLLETTKIISESKCVIGLDSGLHHLAGTTEVPIVVGFTTVLPRHRLPYRHDVLGWNCYPVVLTDKELACNGCQSRWNFSYNVPFDQCYYKDYKCVKLLNSDKYIKELEKIL